MADMQKIMFAELRRKEIAKLVQEKGTVTVEDLCAMYSVSAATIRNDLTELERVGALQRTHGGAIGHSFVNYEPTSQEKEIKNVVQKQAIARKAMEYIHPGDVIVLDTGTTTYELAKLVGKIANLTVITNDLKIACLLEQSNTITVILLGGTVRHQFHCTYGTSVVNALDALYVNTAFLATNGLSLRRGLSTPSMEIAEIKRKIISISDQVILLADSSKQGQESFASFAQLEEVNTLITDMETEEPFVLELQALGVDVQRAD